MNKGMRLLAIISVGSLSVVSSLAAWIADGTSGDCLSVPLTLEEVIASHESDEKTCSVKMPKGMLKIEGVNAVVCEDKENKSTLTLYADSLSACQKAAKIGIELTKLFKDKLDKNPAEIWWWSTNGKCEVSKQPRSLVKARFENDGIEVDEADHMAELGFSYFVVKKTGAVITWANDEKTCVNGMNRFKISLAFSLTKDKLKSDPLATVKKYNELNGTKLNLDTFIEFISKVENEKFKKPLPNPKKK